MPQSLARIYLHIVFSTKERRSYLRDEVIRRDMHDYLGGILRGLECPSLRIGGTGDHVHALCILQRTVATSDLIRDLKRDSSAWVKSKFKQLGAFHWQDGYGVFSVGQSQVKTVQRYIDNQAQHHQQHSFKDEFRALLEKLPNTGWRQPAAG